MRNSFLCITLFSDDIQPAMHKSFVMFDSWWGFFVAIKCLSVSHFQTIRNESVTWLMDIRCSVICETQKLLASHINHMHSALRAQCSLASANCTYNAQRKLYISNSRTFVILYHGSWPMEEKLGNDETFLYVNCKTHTKYRIEICSKVKEKEMERAGLRERERYHR